MALLITRQVGQGDGYGDIKRVISIVITVYTLIHDNDSYHNRFTMYDPKTDTQFTDLLEINSLELSKLPKESDSTELWDWLMLFKAEKEEEFDMVAQANQQLEKAVVVLKQLSADEQTRMIYESREKMRRDNDSRLRGARAEGEKSGKIEIAKNCISLHMPIDEIAKITGLPIDEINKLHQ